MERKYFVISAVFFYIIAISLWIYFYKQDTISDDTGVYNHVRFCCRNTETCTDSFVNKHFNSSLIPFNEYENDTKALKIVLGEPKCTVFENNKSWKFDEVSKDL